VASTEPVLCLDSGKDHACWAKGAGSFLLAFLPSLSEGNKYRDIGNTFNVRALPPILLLLDVGQLDIF
jgi:hypothetical protein